MWRSVVAVFFAVLSLSAATEPLLLDRAFPAGSGPDDYVRFIAIQPDGRILLAGSFSNYSGLPAPGLTRLLPDGSRDSTFNPGPFIWLNSRPQINRVALLPDRRLVVAGYFTQVAGAARTNLAVLNPDGTLDTHFGLPQLLPAGSSANALYSLSNGLLLVTGSFTNIGAHPSAKVAQLHSDGSVETSFRSPLRDPSEKFSDVIVTADGTVLLSGQFAGGTDPDLPEIVRLNPDGSIDRTFQVEVPPATTRIGRLTGLSDGGFVAEISSQSNLLLTDAPRSLIRWDRNGRLDSSFSPLFNYSGSVSGVYSRIVGLWPQPDGGLLVSGTFLEVNGIQRLGLARLNSDGRTDLCFDPGIATDPFILASATQPDGAIMIGGPFRGVEGQHHPYLARLRPASPCGAGEITFASEMFKANESAPSALISLLRNGPLNESQTVHLSTGTGSAAEGDDYLPVEEDVVFSPGDRARTVAIPLRLDDRVEGEESVSLLLRTPAQGGGAERVGNASLVVVDQTNYWAAGQVDPSFIADLDGPVRACRASRARNGWLAGIASTNGPVYFNPTNELRRLRPNGSRDTTFAWTNLFDGTIHALAELQDGRWLVAGEFTHVNDRFMPGLVRVEADGKLDGSFAPLAELANTNSWIGPFVLDVVLHPDGSCVCSGAFPLAGIGSLTRRLVRVRPDGALDRAFGETADQAPGFAGPLIQLTDGSYAAGLNGAPTIVARYLPDGSRDAGFQPPAYTPTSAAALVQMPDSTLVCAGGPSIGIPLLTPSLARLTSNGGKLDLFQRNVQSWLNEKTSRFTRLLALSDGRLLAAGELDFGAGTTRTTLVRIHGDGTWDTSFDAGSGAMPRQFKLSDGSTQSLPPNITLLEEQSDGAIVVAGDFGGFNGWAHPFMVKLLPISDQAERSIHLALPALQVQERSGTNVQILLVRGGGTLTGASVRVRTVPGSAVAGADFLPVDQVVQFAAGEWQKAVQVRVNDNSFAEGDRQFQVQIESPSDSVRLAEPVRTLVAILDDDTNVEFGTNLVVASESDAYVSIPIQRTGLPGNRIEVEVTGDPGVSRAIVEFPPASSAQPVTRALRLRIADDPDLHPDLLATLRMRVLSGDATVGRNATAILLVADNDFAQAPGRGVSGFVTALVNAPDGGVYIAGDFVAVDGQERNSVARLLPNGNVDFAFNPGGGPNGPISSLAVQSDGKLVLGGDFTSFSGVLRTRVARLHADGALDTAFDPGKGPINGLTNGVVHCLETLADNRVMVGGVFNAFDGYGAQGIVRLLASGQPDPSFASSLKTYTGLGFPPRYPESDPSTVTEIHDLGSRGTLLVGELFYAPSKPLFAIPSTATALLLEPSGGTVSNAFFQSGVNAISTAIPLSGGNFLVGGTRLRSTWQGGTDELLPWVLIQRLTTDGQRDASFSVKNVPELGLSATVVRQLLAQPDGKILFLATGQRVQPGSPTSIDVIGRLWPDGEWDGDFQILFSTNSVVRTILPKFPYTDLAPTATASSAAGITRFTRQPDGTLVLAGGFEAVNGQSRRALARIYPNGQLRGQLSLSLKASDTGALELTSESEIPVPYVLQRSGDLRSWIPVQTNATPSSVLQLYSDRLQFGPRQFFRLVPQRR